MLEGLMLWHGDKSATELLRNVKNQDVWGSMTIYAARYALKMRTHPASFYTSQILKNAILTLEKKKMHEKLGPYMNNSS